MKAIRFTYHSDRSSAGYRCSEPGEQSGEYVPADVARQLLAACEEANKFVTHLLQTRAIRDDASVFSWNMLNALLTDLPDAIAKTNGT